MKPTKIGNVNMSGNGLRGTRSSEGFLRSCFIFTTLNVRIGYF